VASAAMIGGITYFHELAYDLLAENDRIIAASFDAAIAAHKKGTLQKVTIISSSMVFENATEFPTPEGAERRSPPPSSTYGFQKLSCEYYAQGAWEQYKLPYTICRPFNCVGIGERRALHDTDVTSGNIKLAMSHVVPDIVQKILKGQDPLHILGGGDQVRCYTYGGDLAKGIAAAMFHPAANNEDFNLSTPVATTVLELAQVVWSKIHGAAKPFRYVSDKPFPYDVQRRIPNTDKAKRVLGFEATTTLSETLDEVIPWIAEEIKLGRI
jgi:nucleoside-diphosphate-sugar epimerase